MKKADEGVRFYQMFHAAIKQCSYKPLIMYRVSITMPRLLFHEQLCLAYRNNLQRHRTNRLHSPKRNRSLHNLRQFPSQSKVYSKKSRAI